MTQHLHHHHPEAGTPKLGTMYLCLAINLVFVAAEAAAGYWSNSTGLLSDAGHNLSDTLGLVLSIAAILLARNPMRNNLRISRTITLVNASLLMLAVVIICAESIRKLVSPQPLDSGAVMITAGVGILVNGLTARLLMRGSSDINIKAAYLHAATDMLVSVGVVLSGLIIRLTGLYIIDPLVSLVITAVIAVPTARLMHSTITLLRQA